MTTVELLREKAHEYELQAVHEREKIPPGANTSAGLFFAIQDAVFCGIAVALREIADALEEGREAA